MAIQTHQRCSNQRCAIPTICDCDQQMADQLGQTEYDGERHLQEAYRVLDRSTVDRWLTAAGRFEVAPRGVMLAHLRLQDHVACTERCKICLPQCFACLSRYEASTICPCH
jgi:hypothetical protein